MLDSYSFLWLSSELGSESLSRHKPKCCGLGTITIPCYTSPHSLASSIWHRRVGFDLLGETSWDDMFELGNMSSNCWVHRGWKRVFWPIWELAVRGSSPSVLCVHALWTLPPMGSRSKECIGRAKASTGHEWSHTGVSGLRSSARGSCAISPKDFLRAEGDRKNPVSGGRGGYIKSGIYPFLTLFSHLYLPSHLQNMVRGMNWETLR